MIALTAHLAQVGDLPVDEPLAVRLGAVEQPRDAGCGEQSVVLGFERRELFTSNVGAAARHHDGGIPPQKRKRSAEGVKTFELLFELLVR